MLRILAIAAFLSLPAVASAQTAPETKQAESGKPPARIRNVTINPNEACPASTSDEIVASLEAVTPVTGTARVVQCAPKVALALGYDVDAALERRDP